MRFQVDLAELDDVIAGMESFEQRLRQQLDALEAVVEKLHGTWTGGAAAAHREAHAKLAAGAQDVHRSVVEMRQAARHAHQGYSAAAQANVSMWSQVR